MSVAITLCAFTGRVVGQPGLFDQLNPFVALVTFDTPDFPVLLDLSAPSNPLNPYNPLDPFFGSETGARKYGIMRMWTA